MLALSSMRGLLDLFQLRVDLDERVLDRRDQRAELLLAPRQIDRRLAMHVADLLIGQLQELVGAGFERGCGERLECVAQLVVLCARLREASSQPAAKPATSAPTTASNFQYSECNSDYRIVSDGAGARRPHDLRNWLPRFGLP